MLKYASALLNLWKYMKNRWKRLNEPSTQNQVKALLHTASSTTPLFMTLKSFKGIFVPSDILYKIAVKWSFFLCPVVLMIYEDCFGSNSVQSSIAWHIREHLYFSHVSNLTPIKVVLFHCWYIVVQSQWSFAHLYNATPPQVQRPKIGTKFLALCTKSYGI